MFRTALLALSLVSAPALATSHYQAEPSARAAEAKLVLRDTVWKCGDAGCAAAKSNSRPTIVCAVLAKEVGALRSFSAGGKPLAADELEKCNSRAN